MESKYDNVEIFYSVFVPGNTDEFKSRNPNDMTKRIFNQREDAVEFMRDYKKARFRSFHNFGDALDFAQYGTIDVARLQQLQTKQPNIIDTVNNHKTTNITSSGEKVCPFKAPKPQDMIKLRKAIESGDYNYVKTATWENPRLLISNGDTPSILQEGFRYNSLHVAAKFKRPLIAELVLTTISDERFIKSLYGDDMSFEDIENRIQALLDLYLNTPDRGSNETPLHFAVKFGAAEVVEILVSFPQSDQQLRNKYGQTPDMIICDRCEKKDLVLYKQIEALLKNHYYVPVLRAVDNSIQPIIGEPFSPGNPPVKLNDPLSPRVEIHAYAGPMNREGAEQFRKLWKTPPRTTTRTSTPKKNCKTLENDDEFINLSSLRYKDHLKGLERLGQKLAYKCDVNWKEYWPFLDCFIDITSNDGLEMLENHLKMRSNNIDKSYDLELNQKDSNDSKNDNNYSTISDLCHTFQRCCNLNDSIDDGTNDENFSPFLCIEKSCNVFANRIVCDIINRITTTTITTINSLNLLINQMKQIEILITSYMEDKRFKSVNFKCLHYRLGHLIANKLQQYLTNNQRKDLLNKFEQFLNESIEIFDYSSSDNERDIGIQIATIGCDSKPTTLKQQLICLIDFIYKCLNENNFDNFDDYQQEIDFINLWNNSKECDCIYHLRKSRKTAISRSNSFKYKIKNDFNIISRKLFNNDGKSNTSEDLQEDSNNNSNKTDSDIEEFYTPPSSPSQLYTDTDDEFSDTQLLIELFIDGDLPTKTDCDVFNALKYSNIQLNPKQYPNIYRWYHNVNLYTETERDNWPNNNDNNNKKLNESMGTPSNRKVPQSPPPLSATTSKSWLRITGANSPKTKTNKQSPKTIFCNLVQKN